MSTCNFVSPLRRQLSAVGLQSRRHHFPRLCSTWAFGMTDCFGLYDLPRAHIVQLVCYMYLMLLQKRSSAVSLLPAKVNRAVELLWFFLLNTNAAQEPIVLENTELINRGRLYSSFQRSCGSWRTSACVISYFVCAC